MDITYVIYVKCISRRLMLKYYMTDCDPWQVFLVWELSQVVAWMTQCQTKGSPINNGSSTYLRVVFGWRASPGGGGRPSPPCLVPPAWGLTDLLSRGDWFSILSWYLHLAIRVPVQRTKEGDRWGVRSVQCTLYSVHTATGWRLFLSQFYMVGQLWIDLLRFRRLQTIKYGPL